MASLALTTLSLTGQKAIECLAGDISAVFAIADHAPIETQQLPLEIKFNLLFFRCVSVAISHVLINNNWIKLDDFKV